MAARHQGKEVSHEPLPHTSHRLQILILKLLSLSLTFSLPECLSWPSVNLRWTLPTSGEWVKICANDDENWEKCSDMQLGWSSEVNRDCTSRIGVHSALYLKALCTLHYFALCTIFGVHSALYLKGFPLCTAFWWQTHEVVPCWFIDQRKSKSVLSC